MRIVWVLTVLHLVNGGMGTQPTSTQTAPLHASAPSDPQYEQLTIGLYESKIACRHMRGQLLHAPGFKPGSAQCIKELN